MVFWSIIKWDTILKSKSEWLKSIYCASESVFKKYSNFSLFWVHLWHPNLDHCVMYLLFFRESRRDIRKFFWNQNLLRVQVNLFLRHTLAKNLSIIKIEIPTTVYIQVLHDYLDKGKLLHYVTQDMNKEFSFSPPLLKIEYFIAVAHLKDSPESRAWKGIKNGL